jgi:MFS family permease
VPEPASNSGIVKGHNKASIIQLVSKNPSSTRQDFHRLLVLIAVSCLDLMGSAMVFPLIPFYAQKLNISPVAIGTIFSSFFVAQLIAAPMWGRVSDHYGRRPALLIGLGCLGAGYLIFAFANSVWLLLLSRIVQGAGGGTTGVTQAYVADTVRPEDRARALGWLSAATNLGTMIGPVIGSFATYWGQAGPGVIAGVLCCVNFVFAWKLLPESRKPGTSAPVRKPVWHGVWTVLRHPSGPLQRLMLIYAVGMFGFSTMSAVLSLFLGAEFGFTERTIGYVFFYVGIFSVIMRSALIGPIVDRIGESQSIRIGAVCLIVGLLGYPIAPNLWILAAIIPLIPIGTALLFPATTALMSKASVKAEVGTTMGIAQTFAGISRLIAPVVSTWLFQYAGHRSPFIFAAAAVGLVTLLSVQVVGSPVVVDAKHSIRADG